MNERSNSARRWGWGVVALALVATGLSTAAPAMAASLSAGGPYTGAEGAPVTITGTGDGSSGYTWTAIRNPNGETDGATCQIADKTSLTTQVWCNDDGSFLVTLTDANGVSSTAKLTLTNVDPKVTISAPTTGTAVGIHDVVNVSAGFTDPGYVDAHHYVIAWGDGSTSSGPAPETQQNGGSGTVTGSHSYATAGNKTITVTVFEGHPGSTDTATVGITVVGGRTCPRVSGKGRLPHHRRSYFSIWAHCGTSGAVGAARIRLPRHGRLAATRVTLLRGKGHSATFAGTGKWQRWGKRRWSRGYKYVISVVDKGRNTRTRHDWMRVVVRKPNGTLVMRVKGPIAGGNIIVRR